jgi:hypothetical protein
MRQEKHRWSELEPSQRQLQLLPGFEVKERSWATSQEPLVTLGVAACVAMVAYNEKSRFGILGHFATLSESLKWSDSAKFQSAINVLDQLGDRATTEVLLLGASPYFEDDSDTMNDRVLAEELLQSAGWAAQCNWSDIGCTIDVRLDCPNGLLQTVNYHYGTFNRDLEALRRPFDD